jgi:hypothetical protein
MEVTHCNKQQWLERHVRHAWEMFRDNTKGVRIRPVVFARLQQRIERSDWCCMEKQRCRNLSYRYMREVCHYWIYSTQQWQQKIQSKTYDYLAELCMTLGLYMVVFFRAPFRSERVGYKPVRYSMVWFLHIRTIPVHTLSSHTVCIGNYPDLYSQPINYCFLYIPL